MINLAAERDAVVVELADLCCRIESMELAIAADDFYSRTQDDRNAFVAQLRYMQDYAGILRTRIVLYAT